MLARAGLPQWFAPSVARLGASSARSATPSSETNPAMRSTVDPIADAGWSGGALARNHRHGGAPYQGGAGGDWLIDRTTTLLPFCNYYNEIGIYSMRSYTLSRQVSKTQVQISLASCPAAPAPRSRSMLGPCPPK